MSDCERFSQIAQDKWATVSESLRSLRGNEWPWGNAQVAQDKWATKSDSLRSLRGNERMSKWAMSKNIWLKKSQILFQYVLYTILKKIVLKKWANRLFLLISSFLVRDVSKSLISLKSNERCEQITQVAHQKWATMSDSLRLLTKNERMSELLIFLNQSLICSFLDKKRGIRSEIKWANSQPCIQPYFFYILT